MNLSEIMEKINKQEALQIELKDEIKLHKKLIDTAEKHLTDTRILLAKLKTEAQRIKEKEDEKVLSERKENPGTCFRPWTVRV